MSTKTEVVEFLRNELLQEGYDALSEEDIENIIYSEIVVSTGGKQFNGNHPINMAHDFLNLGQPIYIKKKDGSVTRVTQDGPSGNIQSQEIRDTYEPIPIPQAPGTFSRALDWITSIFGVRIDSCKRWDEYLDKRTEQRELVATIKAITGKTLNPQSKANTANEVSSQAPPPAYSANADMPYISKMPLDINLSSDVNMLSTFLKENNMSEYNRQRLINRINTSEKLKKMAEAPVSPDCPSPLVTENGVILPKAKQLERQSTSNGCWSVSMQSLLDYHGVKLNQQEIRDYRPDCSISTSSYLSLEGQHSERNLYSQRMNTNAMNEIADFSDLIHTTVKDVALHHLTIGGEGVKETFKEVVTRALKEHNSPVCMLYKGHYRTIVGIENDDLLLLNPQNTYSEVEGKIKPTREKISKYAYDGSVVMLDWLEKINPTMRPAINESLEKFRTLNILSRHEGVTTSDTTFRPNGSQLTYDIVYPKSYDNLQKVASKSNLKVDANTVNIMYGSQPNNDPIIAKQAKVLTIQERQKLEKKILQTTVTDSFEHIQSTNPSKDQQPIEKKAKHKGIEL